MIKRPSNGFTWGEERLEVVLYSIRVSQPSQKCLTKLCTALAAVVLCSGAPSGHQVILSEIIRAYQFHTKLSQTSKTRQSPMCHECLTHITYHFAFSETTLSQHMMYSPHLLGGQQWKTG